MVWVDFWICQSIVSQPTMKADFPSAPAASPYWFVCPDLARLPPFARANGDFLARMKGSIATTRSQFHRWGNMSTSDTKVRYDQIWFFLTSIHHSKSKKAFTHIIAVFFPIKRTLTKNSAVLSTVSRNQRTKIGHTPIPAHCSLVLTLAESAVATLMNKN